ncbi:PREDICTED: putative uncharacterized protein FLJ44672, partial [Rhinopithecus bieti]|uniref:putative uncharacterized protein FLJ44672 n=1 Tax=Rhinopithecus bieti TaxID=61621 RepID=UPI00083C4465
QARLGPHCGISGLGSCPPTASPGPRLPPAGFSRPSFGHTGILCRPTLSSSGPLQGSLLLPAAPAGPTRPPVGLRRPSSCLSAASPAARLPQVSLSRPCSSCLPLASSCPPPFTLLGGLPGPASDFWRPPRAQDLTSSRPLHGQPPASRRPTQAQPLPPRGLSTPSSRLTVASPGQSSSCLSAPPTAPLLPPSDLFRPNSFHTGKGLFTGEIIIIGPNETFLKCI